jgi:hypothetical protein
VEEGNEASSSKEAKDNGQQNQTESSEEGPIRPEILDHLVLGINENIKAIETAIDDLKLRLLMMADRLNGSQLKPNSDLLPTAPSNVEKSDSPEPEVPASAPASPPAFIIIPLHSISPQSLVGGIPQYAATYNSLVWQWGQLSKTVKTRFKEEQWGEVIGEDREELRVVPLGRVEAEMAAMVGLRRLACLAIRVRQIRFGDTRTSLIISAHIRNYHYSKKSYLNQFSILPDTLSHYHTPFLISKFTMAIKTGMPRHRYHYHTSTMHPSPSRVLRPVRLSTSTLKRRLDWRKSGRRGEMQS